MSRFGLPAETFQLNDKLNFSLYAIIRKKVQESYIIGLEAVEGLILKRIPNFELFMSVTDIDLVKNLSDSLLPQFWLTVNTLLQRENRIRQQNITGEDKKPFDSKAAMTKFSSMVIYMGYNAAIDSKLKNILPGQRKGSSRIASTFTDFDPLTDSNKLDEAFGDFSVLDELQEMIDNMKEMFLTKEDQKVDTEICEPLNRAVFGIDDADKPDPPLHPYCRCILVPVETKVSEFFAS